MKIAYRATGGGKGPKLALNTPRGSVFSGHADGVEMQTTDGTIAINPREESYLNLTLTTQITLRVRSEFHRFAAASLREGQLTVLAEEIHEVQPAATPDPDTQCP